jgi:hypothetical protein
MSKNLTQRTQREHPDRIGVDAGHGEKKQQQRLNTENAESREVTEKKEIALGCKGTRRSGCCPEFGISRP